MNIIGDVLKELFKMFVADLRLTLATLAGIGVVAIALAQEVVGPTAAALALCVICVLVLAEAVLREARNKRS